MDNQLVRLIILLVFIFLLTSDIKDLLDALSTTSTVGPYLSKWKPSLHPSQNNRNRRNSNMYKRSISRNARLNDIREKPFIDEEDNADDTAVKLISVFPSGTEKTLRKPNKRVYKKIDPGNLYGSLTDEEKQELFAMKSQMTKVMQDWCLPKLVCELHASIGDRSTSLSEAEQGLLSIIKDTSMNPMGDVISKYHFAAHMGQLLANVEGNGCHNFYPNCPLSGTKVLQMVRKVRIK